MAPSHPTQNKIISHDTGYTISPDGEVRNTKRDKPLKPFPVSGGHLLVHLPSGRYYIHRLVAEAFHGAAPEGHVATHRDRDVTNNHASNIMWSTKSEIISASWARRRSAAQSEATVNG